MRDTRRNRLWALAGVFALALTAGIATKRAAARRDARLTASGEELRDAVAAPSTVGLAGRPVPTSWFKGPAERRAEIDSALMGSRPHRSPVARSVAVQ
jgi:hypothetical protein